MASLRLAILAECQTCLNKINERAAFERFKKCKAIGECIRTVLDFRVKNHNDI